VNDVFLVLAEPQRRRLLDVLRAGEQPVGGLVESLGIPQPAVSKHLKTLRAAGFVEVRPMGQQRLYRLQAKAWREVDEWLAPYRDLWADRLDDLERIVDTLES
jgi:DNA-binding transcriptional ArsR family regulator